MTLESALSITAANPDAATLRRAIIAAGVDVPYTKVKRIAAALVGHGDSARDLALDVLDSLAAAGLACRITTDGQTHWAIIAQGSTRNLYTTP